MAKRQKTIRNLIFFLYFFLASLAVTFPLIFHLNEYIFGLGDELLITWIINWNIHALTNDILNIYNAPFFHPYPLALTYSDAFLTSSLIALIPVSLFKEPVISYNINVLTSITLLGFSVYLVTAYITKKSTAGIISGTYAAFSIYTVTKYFHLQVITIHWMIFSIYFLLRYLQKKEKKLIIFSSLMLILQAANSFLPVFFFFIFLVVFLSTLFFSDRKAVINLLNKYTIIALFIVLASLLLLALPYLMTSQKFNYVRDIRDTIRFANRPEYILFPSIKTRFHDNLMILYKHDKNPIKHDGYLGFPLMFFGVIALFLGWKMIGKNVYFKTFSLLALLSYILSLGPVLQWGGRVIKEPFMIPLPYAFLYYLLPGFKGFRNSARWEMLVVISFSLIIGIVFAYLMKIQKVSNNKQIIMTLLLSSYVFLEINLPFQYVSVPQIKSFPKVSFFVKDLPKDSVLVELPVYNWNVLPYALTENMRLLYQTHHFIPMVNGTSGFSPPQWQEEVMTIYFNFPNRETITLLKKMGVTHIIVHKAEYDALVRDNFALQGNEPKNSDRIVDEIRKFEEIKLLKSFDEDLVYLLQ